MPLRIFLIVHSLTHTHRYYHAACTHSLIRTLLYYFTDRLSKKVLFLQGDAKEMMMESLQQLLLKRVPDPHTSQRECGDEDPAAVMMMINKTLDARVSAVNETLLDIDQPKHPKVAWILIQFPDPWTKVKHLKRRLVDASFVHTCASIIPSTSYGKLMVY